MFSGADSHSFNRTLSLGGHVESQENKKLCFCTASLVLNSRLANSCAVRKQSFLFPRDSTWPLSDKGLFRTIHHKARLNSEHLKFLLFSCIIWYYISRVEISRNLFLFFFFSRVLIFAIFSKTGKSRKLVRIRKEFPGCFEPHYGSEAMQTKLIFALSLAFIMRFTLPENAAIRVLSG